MEERAPIALSLDLDGVVFPRVPIQFKALWHYLRHGPSIYDPANPIPQISHRQMRVTKPLSPWESVSFNNHKRREVPIEVIEAISLLDPKSFDIFGNTGRLYDAHWLGMTQDALRRGGIYPRFRDIYYKPPKISGRDSKLAAVFELDQLYPGHVIHVDDNPADGVYIAASMPNIRVFIVQDLTTGMLFSEEEARRFPNVQRVATFRGAVDSIISDL